MTKRVATFVDGENICADHADIIRDLATRFGSPDLLRVYGNVCLLPGWQKAAGYRLIHTGTGKNATDLLMTIEAMEFALSGAFGTILIASSDGDFAHLAVRLRERGLTVIGAGQSHSPAAFRAVCTRFETLETAPPQTPAEKPAQLPLPASELDRRIKEAIGAHGKNGTGMPISALSAFLHSRHGVRISSYPEGNWRAYLSSRSTLFDLDPRGPDARVRFRPAGVDAAGAQPCRDVREGARKGG